MILGGRGPVVLLSAPVAARVERALTDAEGAALRQGLRIDPEVAEFLVEVRRVAAWWRSADVPAPEATEQVGEGAEEEFASDDWLDVAAVADRLGCTTRNVRYLAGRRRLGRRVRGRWLFDPVEVDAYAAGRDGVSA